MSPAHFDTPFSLRLVHDSCDEMDTLKVCFLLLGLAVYPSDGKKHFEMLNARSRINNIINRGRIV